MKRRRPIRTAVLLLGLCLTLWRLPTTIETFAASMGAGGTPTQSLMAALNSAAGGSSLQQAEAETPTKPGIIAAGGRELSDEERERMMRQARAMAPLPLDGSGSAKSKKDRDQTAPPGQEDMVAALQQQLEEAMKLKSPK